jgi:hypothetical protein
MGKTAFSGPVVGSSDANAGSLDGLPLELQSRSQWVSYFNDFNDNDVDFGIGLTGGIDIGTSWSLNQVSGGGSARIGILEAEGAARGYLVLDCPANLDGPIVQRDGSLTANLFGGGVNPAAAVSGTSVSTEFVFASRFAIQDVSAQGVFVGLAELNGSSAVIGTPTGAITSDTHIGFSQAAGDAGALIFSVSGDTDTTADSITGTSVIGSPLTDGEFIEIAVRGKGLNQYEAFVKQGGEKKRWSRIGGGTSTTSWDAQMLITLANLGAGTGDDLLVDYVYLATKRDLLV